MATTVRGLRLRRSFRDVERDHYALRTKGFTGKTELEQLVIAFKGIQELPPTDPNSFFTIGGYHGEPFRGAGWSNPMWWGGYCFHGQILFPTWHRAYVNRLEDALRSIPGCDTVTLPFLDWCDDATKNSGLPETLTSKKFVVGDGAYKKEIDNPLYSYRFQKGCFNSLPAVWNGEEMGDYTKLAGYETVRFPYSGLMGNAQDREKSEAWNRQVNGKDPVAILNHNVRDWLYYSYEQTDPKTKKPIKVHNGTAKKFAKCLDAPNYTLFSNTSSASQYNEEQLNRETVKFSDGDVVVVPLESPHNDMHLAVGGFYLGSSDTNPDKYMQANGDMGENDTAGLDPIFFLHHCFIDRMFWLWQLKHNQINELVISPDFAHYPGTNNFDSQGPTPGKGAGESLSLKTTLDPFTKDGSLMTSLDVINIEHQLGYTYGPGSFTDAGGYLKHEHELKGNGPQTPIHSAVTVKGLNRGGTSGSFFVTVERNDEHGRAVIGAESVLNRWNTVGCANCQTHLHTTAHIPLPGIMSQRQYEEAKITVKLHTRGKAEPKDITAETGNTKSPYGAYPRFPKVV